MLLASRATLHRNIDVVQLPKLVWYSLAMLLETNRANTTHTVLEQVLLQVLMRIVKANQRQLAPRRKCWWWQRR